MDDGSLASLIKDVLTAWGFDLDRTVSQSRGREGTKDSSLHKGPSSSRGDSKRVNLKRNRFHPISKAGETVDGIFVEEVEHRLMAAERQQDSAGQDPVSYKEQKHGSPPIESCDSDVEVHQVSRATKGRRQLRSNGREEGKEGSSAVEGQAGSTPVTSNSSSDPAQVAEVIGSGRTSLPRSPSPMGLNTIEHNRLEEQQDSKRVGKRLLGRKDALPTGKETNGVKGEESFGARASDDDVGHQGFETIEGRSGDGSDRTASVFGFSREPSLTAKITLLGDELVNGHPQEEATAVSDRGRLQESEGPFNALHNDKALSTGIPTGLGRQSLMRFEGVLGDDPDCLNEGSVHKHSVLAGDSTQEKAGHQEPTSAKGALEIQNKYSYGPDIVQVCGIVGDLSTVCTCTSG